MGLIEAQARRIPLKVLIMDNGCAMATGGQPVSRMPAGSGAGRYGHPLFARLDKPADPRAVREVFKPSAGLGTAGNRTRRIPRVNAQTN